mmetsp:Transcript_56429/g.132974  ORF Transcript_56429/g.132974 Transcript_56429/m.132974 type:complete len:255 (-) Transcript_56429:12-776(-)
MHEGVWGEVTSSIEWCEDNYEVSPWIAEFWNTMSSLLFVFGGLIGLWSSSRGSFEWRFVATFVGIVVVGIGSALFHATLLHASQQLDETPMVWTMLCWGYVLFEPDLGAHLRPYFGPVLAVYAVVFSVVHWFGRFTTAFQVHFIVLVLGCIPRVWRYSTQCHDSVASKVFQVYMQTYLIGSACWLTDLHLCHTMKNLPVNPQGHAWWHLFMAINSYLGPVFMQFVRGRQLGWNVEIAWRFGFVPIVVRRGSSKQ